MELNTEPKEGWLNRHVTPLPINAFESIIILHKDANKEQALLCEWTPADFMHSNKEFLGTAKEINANKRGFRHGYNAWVNNSSEFVYYKIVKDGDKLQFQYNQKEQSIELIVE